MTYGSDGPASPEPTGDYAGEVWVSGGAAPAWLRWLPHVFAGWGLAYIVAARAFDPVNLTVGALLVLWMVYTPIARRRGWFFIPM